MGSRAVGAPLRRRSRDARAAGDHPRHRRRARAEGAGLRSRRSTTSTKAMPRSSCCSASATCARAGCELRGRARRSAAHDGVHDAHAGGRRPRRVSVPPGRNAPGRRVGRPRRLSRDVPRARPLRQRRRPDVQHDRAGAAHERRGQRRQPAARRSHQADVAADLAGACRSSSCRCRSITNGVHVPTWMSSEIGALLERHLGPDWLERHDDPALCDRVLRHSRRGAVGGAPGAARRSSSTSSASARGSAGRTRTSRAARIVAAGTMFDHNTLTIGFARRFTGYKRPELIFPDPDRLAAHPQRRRAAPVQIRVRRQGAPGRRRRQASPAAHLPARARSEVRRPHRLRRRLRPARRALPRAGLRRLDEQPAQAARGQRHERHEGGDQRHAAHVDRRRLVGRGLHRRQRLADRGPGRPERSRRAGLGRRAGASTRCIEQQLVPAFYERDAQGIPRRWLQIVKQSIRTVLPRFSARRMVKEYVRDDVPAGARQPVAK